MGGGPDEFSTGVAYGDFEVWDLENGTGELNEAATMAPSIQSAYWAFIYPVEDNFCPK